MKQIFLLCALLGLAISACNPGTSLNEDVLIKKCIEAHGGMEKWKSMDTTVYKKNISLFNEDGSLEKEIKQSHIYISSPSLKGTITWDDSIQRQIVYDKGEAYKINGNQREKSSKSALNSFNSAYYVLNMPWKLMDDAADVTYEGIDTILKDMVVHALRVEYPTEEKQDIWKYYLDEKEFFLVANMVHHGETYSMITNDEYTEYKGLKFNAKRTSYMVDSLGEILYLRAKYVYEFGEEEVDE